MSTPSTDNQVAAELTAALKDFACALDALKRADALAEEGSRAADQAATEAKKVSTEEQVAARRLHDEVHAVKEEAYDVFTQLASLEVRRRTPLDAPAAGAGEHVTTLPDTSGSGGGGGGPA